MKRFTTIRESFENTIHSESKFIHISKSMIGVLDSTFVRSGHANVRVVIEGSEEVFVRYPDVTHPLEQVLRFCVVQQVLDETPGGCDVHRTLADDEVMRRR